MNIKIAAKHNFDFYGKTFFIETYGCQMNSLDSELVEISLKNYGFELAQSEDQADVVILNTCSVRDLAEQKVRSHLGRLAKQKENNNPELVIAVIGCMAEREHTYFLKKAPYVDVICGPDKLSQLPNLLIRALENQKPCVAVNNFFQNRARKPEVDSENFDSLLRPLNGRTQAYVRITRGCNKLCSFCVVPFTRGPEVHRSPDKILADVKRLVDGGVLEITLLGQTVNHYLHIAGDTKTRLADLLWQIHEACPELPRLRFITSLPRDFDTATLEVMSKATRICRYLHLPVQSGSNKILRAMNRGHTIESYLELLERARNFMPDVALAGDMIVGFPGETQADHQASLELLRAAAYKNCYIFKYSPRPNTVAAMQLKDDVPEEVKKERNLELLEVQNEICLINNRQHIGKKLEIIVESPSKYPLHVDETQNIAVEPLDIKSEDHQNILRLIGRTRGDEIVVFDGPAKLIGQIVHVRAFEATTLTIRAKLEDNL